MNAAGMARGSARRGGSPSGLSDHIVLADWRRVRVRPIVPGDVMAEQAFVSSLSLESRYRRFHVGLNELPAQVLASWTAIDYRSHVAIVAESWERAIVADARYVVESDRRSAEFGLAVADGWQGVGLGRQLVSRLAAFAYRDGIRRLTGTVLHDNRPMLALVRSLGGWIEASPTDPAILIAQFDLASGGVLAGRASA
jgi:acetyltransferase